MGLTDVIMDVLSENVRHVKGGINRGVRHAAGKPTTVKPGGAKGGSVIWVAPENRNVPLPKGFHGPTATRGQMSKVNLREEPRKKKSKDSKNHDFNLGKLDSASNWSKEFAEDDSYLGLLKRTNRPENYKKAFWHANDELKGFEVGEALGNSIRGIHETANRPWLSYDKDEGLDADWDSVGDKALMSLGAIPAAGRVKGGITPLGKAFDGPVPIGKKPWYKTGKPAPENRQLPNGQYNMGPAMHPVAGIPTRYGGHVVDPRRHQQPVYSNEPTTLLDALGQLGMF